MIKARVTGGPALAAKFRALESLAQRQILEAALVPGALVVQNEWKRQAPHNESSPPTKQPTKSTGQYRRSIHIGGHTELAPDFEGQDMGYHHRSSSPHRAHVAVGTNITDPPYPYFLEEGTSRMAARPSAGPAFEEKKDEAVEEIRDALRELVRKAV
jgi:HK97 gp10 family phage protein